MKQKKGFGDEDLKSKESKKRSILSSDDDGEDENEKRSKKKKHRHKHRHDKEAIVNEAADEEEEENGHNEENDGESSQQSIASDDDVKKKSDADEMFSKPKMKKNRRKKVDSEELNDMDNIITDIVNEMRAAYEVTKREKKQAHTRFFAFFKKRSLNEIYLNFKEDKISNQNKTPAIRKIKLLPKVVSLLHK